MAKAKSTGKDNSQKYVDILIVGAGIAGLYSAWRLKTKDPNLNIAIVDRLDRTGGRLNTDIIKIPDATGTGVATVREEEGGMRFNYSMEELMALFAALQLCDEVVPFPMNGENNRYYVRGRSFTRKEAEANNYAIWKELFNLKPSEQNMDPVSILTNAYHQILSHNGINTPTDNPTPEYWQHFRLKYTWKGVPLYKWQLWGLLRSMGYSEECIMMMTHSLGFEGPFLSWMSAGEAFQLMEDFPKNPTYYTFRNGFSTLPNALVNRLEKMGVEIDLGVNVDKISYSKRGYEMVLTEAPEGESSNPFIPGGKEKKIAAKKVILAVARKALENLYNTSPALNEQPHAAQLWEDLQTTTDQVLLKINLYYEEPWWENGLTGQPSIKYGPNFTDLPAGSVYPFYSISGLPFNSPAALTIYCDYNNANFWRGLQNLPPLFYSDQQKLHSTKPQTLFAASEAVVEEATRQFKEIFKTNYVPRPVLTSYRSWDGEDDFGFAVHQWAVNAKDDDVMARLEEPVPDIYTCNEAYSDMQGWVNGSLRSADRMLQRFGIEPLVNRQVFCQPPLM
jgi:monoamine oxidase